MHSYSSVTKPSISVRAVIHKLYPSDAPKQLWTILCHSNVVTSPSQHYVDCADLNKNHVVSFVNEGEPHRRPQPTITPPSLILLMHRR